MSGPKVVGTIKYIRPISVWSYNVSEDTCSICSSKLTTECVTCMSDKSISIINNCSVSKGKCGHVFHYHCISSWLKKGSPSCPIDSAPWIYAVENMDKTLSSYNKLIDSKTTSVQPPKLVPIIKVPGIKVQM